MAAVELPEDPDETRRLATALWRVYARSEQGVEGMERALAAIPALAAIMSSQGSGEARAS